MREAAFRRSQTEILSLFKLSPLRPVVHWIINTASCADILQVHVCSATCRVTFVLDSGATAECDACTAEALYFLTNLSSGRLAVTNARHARLREMFRLPALDEQSVPGAK